MPKGTKGAVKARAEGVRCIAFLLDNGEEFEMPDGAEVLVDSVLDLDNPDRTGGDKGYKLLYASLQDPNDPHPINVILDNGVVKDVTIGGQLLIMVSDKAVDKARRRSSR